MLRIPARHRSTASACSPIRPSAAVRLNSANRYSHMSMCSSCAACASNHHRCSRFATTISGSVMPPSSVDALSVTSLFEGRTCHVGDRAIEDVETEVEFGVAHRERRGDAEDTSHRGKLHDVHGKTELEATSADGCAGFGCGLARLAVGHDLDAEEQPSTADIADALMPLLQLQQTVAQPPARLQRAVGEPLPRQNVQ